MFYLQLGVTILGRRFSDTIQSVPIKKRMRLPTGPSAPPPLNCGQASTPEAELASFVEGSSLDNHVDFSGISILADAACKSDLPDEDTNNFPVSEVQSPKGENGGAMPREASEVKSPKHDCTVVPLESSSTHVETTEVLNDGSDKSSKAENVSRGSRFHWDLNIVMDVWDCDQQEGGGGADYEQKSTAVDCNEVCNDHKEGSEKDDNDNQEIAFRNDGDASEITAPKGSFELHGTELRRQGDIVAEVKPKDSIMESITPPRDCSDLIMPPFGPSSAKEEVNRENEPYSNQLSASEHGQLSMCKPADINEEIKMAGSITDKPLEVNSQLEQTTGPERISEECTKESVASVPGSEPKDVMMGNDQTGIDTKMGGDIVEHDSMAGDHKLEHSALQSDCDQLAEEKNHADLPHVETGLMLTIDNDNGHTTDDREKVDQQVDSIASGEVGVEVDKHGNSVEFQDDGDHSDFYPPKKDLEEDDYQYEDGELREPAMHYWGADGFELAETVHGPHEADERGNYRTEALPDAPLLGCVTLDAQGEEKLLMADTGMQLDDCMDTNEIAKTDLESKDQTELLENGQANDSSENGVAESMHSSKAKTTGWDKQPESSRKKSESPLIQESMPGLSSLRRDLSLCSDTLRSADDPHRDDKSFVRSRRYILLGFIFYSCFVF